jgi:hypothetical protein
MNKPIRYRQLDCRGRLAVAAHNKIRLGPQTGPERYTDQHREYHVTHSTRDDGFSGLLVHRSVHLIVVQV